MTSPLTCFRLLCLNQSFWNDLTAWRDLGQERWRRRLSGGRCLPTRPARSKPTLRVTMESPGRVWYCRKCSRKKGPMRTTMFCTENHWLRTPPLGPAWGREQGDEVHASFGPLFWGRRASGSQGSGRISPVKRPKRPRWPLSALSKIPEIPAKLNGKQRKQKLL